MDPGFFHFVLLSFICHDPKGVFFVDSSIYRGYSNICH